MNDLANRREFPRFTINFSLVVTGVDCNGVEVREEAVLGNLSGGGATFISLKKHQYRKDQTLNISIDLPGSAEIGAHMQATARVVRIESSNDPEDPSGARISFEFDTPLRFERLCVEP